MNTYPWRAQPADIPAPHPYGYPTRRVWEHEDVYWVLIGKTEQAYHASALTFVDDYESEDDDA